MQSDNPAVCNVELFVITVSCFKQYTYSVCKRYDCLLDTVFFKLSFVEIFWLALCDIELYCKSFCRMELLVLVLFRNVC